MTRGPLEIDLSEQAAAKPARSGPLVLEGAEAEASTRDQGPAASPQDAPPPPEHDPAADRPAAMARALASAAAANARAPSPLRRRAGPLLAWAFSGLLTMMLGALLWDFIDAMLARHAVLGWIAAALVAGVIGGALALALGELAGLARLRRSEHAAQLATAALAARDRGKAKAAVTELRRLWSGRAEMAWPLDRLAEREAELLDAEALLTEAERLCLSPLDIAARRIAVDTARQVAAATAFVPVPAADVAAALWLNLRMIRRIAEVYGGRAGTLGAWRLFRAVAAHLAATGAVAVGDDLIGPALGGGALAKISRRFGEGVVNGALTARVGVAAIEVCRPLPFHAVERPKARALIGAALSEWKTE